MPSPVVTTNLVLGPADLWVGPLGATEPADGSITPNGVSFIPAAPWTYAGGTDGGVNFEVDTTITGLTVDQIPMEVGGRLTDEKMTVTTKLSEITLANINTAMNGLTAQGGGTGYSTLDYVVGSASTQLGYSALLILGWAPMLSTGAPARRWIIVRKVLNQAKVALMHDKKTQQGIDCAFQCYWLSQSVNPVHQVDQLA